MSLGKTYPRTAAGMTGLRKGMTVELYDGSIVGDIERLLPRDTRFRGVLVRAGERSHLLPTHVGFAVKFIQGQVMRRVEEEA